MNIADIKIPPLQEPIIVEYVAISGPTIRSEGDFPVLQADRYPFKNVPRIWLSEKYAQKMHFQSLDQLARRGGLSPTEIVANITNASYKELMAMTDEYAVEFIQGYAYFDIFKVEDGKYDSKVHRC